MEGYRKLLGIAPKLNIGINIAQFLSFIVNLAFAVIGTLLVTLAYPAELVSMRYDLFVDFGAFKPVILLITTGVIMFIISFLGGIATIARRSVIVNIYVIVLLLLLVVEINVGITTFIVHGNIFSSIKSNMFDTMNNSKSEYIKERWDNMQNELTCCGVEHAYDWAPLHIDGPKVERYDGVTYTVPYSCCYTYFETQACRVKYPGCLDAIRDYISTASAFLGYVALAIVISQLLGLVFAFLLLGNIRHLKTQEEMKRQEIQHLIYTDLHKPEEEKPLLTSSSSDA